MLIFDDHDINLLVDMLYLRMHKMNSVEKMQSEKGKRILIVDEIKKI